MAKATIRFRFVFNRGGGSASSTSAAISKTVNAIVDGVATSYAEGTYRQVKQMIQQRVVKDIGTEISWMAGLVKKSLIGISGGASAPNGMVTFAHPVSQAWLKTGVKPAHQAGAGIKWDKRSDGYLTWKQKHYRHSRWFLNKGDTLPGLLGKKGTWTGAYGPVQVRVMRGSGDAGPIGSGGRLTTQSRYQTRAGRVRYKDAESSTIRKSVCRIEVGAMSTITPAMLPALASGNMEYAPDGRSSGLLDKLGTGAAYRLGGARGRVPYRHTIEPFLSFFLTRAIPNALFLRIEQGLRVNLDPQRRSR